MKHILISFCVIALLVAACAQSDETPDVAQITPAPDVMIGDAPVQEATTRPDPTNTAPPKPTATPAEASPPTKSPAPAPTPTASVAAVDMAELRQVGSEHFLAGEFQEALQVYDDLLEADSSDPLLYVLRSEVLAELGDYDSAIADLLSAVELEETDPAVFNNLCWYYGLTGEPELALPYCQLAVEADPDPSYLDSRGLVYGLLHDFEAAAADFQVVVDALDGAPDPELQAIRAERLVWLAALTAGEDPFTARVLAKLHGQEVGGSPETILVSQGAESEAQPIIGADVQQASSASDHYQQGMQLAQQGQYDSAIAQFTIALDLDPGYIDAYMQRGIAFRFSGQYDRAIADFDQLIAFNPADADAYWERGITYGSMENFSRAIEEYDQAIALNPGRPLYYAMRAAAYMATGRPAEALADYDQALSLSPGDSVTILMRGLAHMALGNADASRADLERALEIGLPPALEDLARQGLEVLG